PRGRRSRARFPYTTLFRSQPADLAGALQERAVVQVLLAQLDHLGAARRGIAHHVGQGMTTLAAAHQHIKLHRRQPLPCVLAEEQDRKSTRLNSSHRTTSYA